MNGNPSEPTYKAIAHCREEFAVVRGVTRNAVDQLMAGNTKDPHIEYRAFFRDVCVTDDSEPDHLINDLLAIKQRYQPAQIQSVGTAALEKMREMHQFIEKYTNAVQDGLDKYECADLISAVSKIEAAAATLKASLINEKNVLSGADVREFARQATNGRAK